MGKLFLADFFFGSHVDLIYFKEIKLSSVYIYISARFGLDQASEGVVLSQELDL